MSTTFLKKFQPRLNKNNACITITVEVLKMSVPLSRLKANANYQAKAYDKVTIAFKKGKREYYKAEAAKRGLSLASLIQTAVEKYIDDTASKPESPT